MTTTPIADAQAVTQALSDATAAAGQAPSIHNTQPWRWLMHDDRLDLFVEDSRTLAITDPDRHLAILSCGAALHHALASLAADGWHTTVTRLSTAGKPGHLATVSVGARIPRESAAIRHLQTIGRRHTDRRPVLGAPVDADKLRSITEAASSQGASLHLLRPQQIVELASAAEQAHRAETDDDAWRAELRYWTGGARALGTGIPDAAIPRSAPQTTVPGRDFGHAGDLDIADTHDRAAVFAILYGPGDDDLDWLRAGEALSAAWLTAVEAGVSVVPMSATMEITATRERVRKLLAGIGHPYLVLRFGVLAPDAESRPHAPRLFAGQTVDPQ